MGEICILGLVCSQAILISRIYLLTVTESVSCSVSCFVPLSQKCV